MAITSPEPVIVAEQHREAQQTGDDTETEQTSDDEHLEAIPWSQLLFLVLLAALAGIIAAIYPSWKASRIDVLDAIGYE